jgi:nicotinamide-nucleotide amidase
MKVEVLSTGTELLRGRNVDTNLAWLARELEKAGLEVRFHQTVDDDFGRLVDAVKLAAARADVVLLTGGLGPTEDDFTRQIAAEAFHRPLVFHARAWARIRARFRKYRVRMARINRRQAYAPRGAALVPNPNGSAPGFALREGGVFFAALPGPPREMQPMFLRHILPRIRRAPAFGVWEGRACGVPESTVDEAVRRIVGTRATYGLTVRGGQVSISVRAEGSRRERILSDLSRRIRSALGESFLDADLPEVVGRMLIRSGTTLALAESCTGGLVAHKLTDVPGISAVLLDAVVAYSNESKTDRLGVPPDLIRRHGAVSEAVARAMAEGAAVASGAALGAAVTGIAGPTGGSKAKPVGLCHMAVDDWVERRVFPGDRAVVKDRAANFLLNMIRLRLLRGERGNARKAVGLRSGR